MTDRSRLGSPRTTVALLVVVLLLVGAAAFEVLYVAEDAAPAASASRPVATGEMTHQAGVEAAARATEAILSTSYRDYDDQLDRATGKMTDAFAARYRRTAEEIRDRFVRQQTDLRFKVVAQSVVRASADRVQALLFLDQYVTKRRPQPGAQDAGSVPVAALVTVVRTDHGWLVSAIDTTV